MKRISKMKDAVQCVETGMSIMIGGFNKSGAPNELVDALKKHSTADHLTLITIDAGVTDSPLAGILEEGRFTKVIGTYFGVNKELHKRVLEATIEYELSPQGTFAERIRAAGAGLGGVITPTGVGTIIEEGKQRLSIGGKDYLLELPLRADVAFIHAEIADESGNLIMTGTARNVNPLMATAADTVIAQVNKIVPVGELDPNDIDVPSIYIDKIVLRENA